MFMSNIVQNYDEISGCTMNVFAASSYLLCFILMYSYGQLLPLTSDFIKQGYVSESMDEGVFAVHILEIKSLIECALRCGMNLLCNAVDFCFLDGLYTCRFRYGHANLSNTITQCEAYENTASKDCPDGLFLRAQGICKINTDECQNDPCLNGATCTNTPGSFNCTCDAGWTGIVCDEVLPNIALRKPAKQSSTFSDHMNVYNAAYAVDGNRGTDVIDNKCTHTREGDSNPWWRVDLQAVYNITSVRILNRGINKYGDLAYRLQDVTVTVGLTESDVNTPCGFFAGPGTASQLVAIDCLTSPQGRFVKISKTTEFLTLCEVDVFGVSV
ncbi:sushi, nidogen and EGF-like domain-containing protein 1 [Crassostrea angulata]|uniref:sushi, nidogen and EGF-like domain-containing protein 1 n=1 Tax=Magallana angulata TaxID=2784310 RepID=UPI0022B2014C|nr:sushi, nidogen and EGF-like domain-containing protein 1 [Crassostrea angulata]